MWSCQPHLVAPRPACTVTQGLEDKPYMNRGRVIADFGPKELCETVAGGASPTRPTNDIDTVVGLGAPLDDVVLEPPHSSRTGSLKSAS